MSHTSSLETHARYSVAISILNNFRHWLIGREGAGLRQDDKDTFLESLDISESEALSDKMVLYSLHGFGSHKHSAAIELSDAINKSLESLESGKKEICLNALRKALGSEDLNNLDQAEKDLLIDFVTRAMYVIDSQDDMDPQNIFTPRDL